MMNGVLGNSSLYTNIVLSKKAFLEFYKTEIDELFKTTTSEIVKRNIHIDSYNDFYNDFIDFVYRFSIKNRPKM
jgi:hypothetical protein